MPHPNQSWRSPRRDRGAAAQYVPFTGPYEDLPAVWVGEGEGAAVLRAARERASATLADSATLRFLGKYDLPITALRAQDESALNQLLESQLPPTVE